MSATERIETYINEANPANIDINGLVARYDHAASRFKELGEWLKEFKGDEDSIEFVDKESEYYRVCYSLILLRNAVNEVNKAMEEISV